MSALATRASFSVATALLVVGCGEIAETTPGPQHPSVPPASRQAPVARVIDLDHEEIGCSSSPPIRRAPPEFDDADPSAVRLFFDVLAPYGTWVDDSRLGLIWTPSAEAVGSDFVPYASHGRWTHRAAHVEGQVVDEYVWVTDEPWGWVAFHYGRWTYAGDRGWAWIPGRRYAGAWVDWRTPEQASGDAIVGWGPTPPAHLWRVVPSASASRARHAGGKLDIREARLFAVPYVAFATPYAYARTKDLFAPDLGARLLYGPAALAVAHGTQPGGPPTLEQLGYRGEVPAPPTLDRGLQQAWLLATPATAMAVGAGPDLGAPPRLRTYVTGGPRWATAQSLSR
ncbi:MAG: hypothetical protein KF819_15420 [Labilithrix sp.]|nr:hypothetical protein [Labilithrix sp.]